MQKITRVSNRRYLRRGESEWRTLIGEFSSSGLTRQAFCAAKGLSVATFDLWRRKLSVRPPVSPMFVEISSPVRAPAVLAEWDVELDLGDGRVLRLRRSSARC